MQTETGSTIQHIDALTDAVGYLLEEVNSLTHAVRLTDARVEHLCAIVEGLLTRVESSPPTGARPTGATWEGRHR